MKTKTNTTIPSVDTSTNRYSGYGYNEIGAVTSDGSYAFSYDALGQPLSKIYNNDSSKLEYYVYTAGDERIGVQRSGWWVWSVRDEGGKVLRQYKSSPTNPSAPALWLEDFVWRDGLLLGSQRPPELGGRRHFHLDHLGTPRLITADNGQRISAHDYYPFGDELSPVSQEVAAGFDREDPLKFTGHERDYAGGMGEEDGHYIDDMHARYYNPAVARFLSPDQLVGSSDRPQSWNSYVYVLDDPIRLTDPTGLSPCANCDTFFGVITVPGEEPNFHDHPGFFWGRWMDHSIFQPAFSVLAGISRGANQVKPYVYGAVQLGILIIPGLGEEEGVVLTAEAAEELAATVESAELRNVIRATFKASDEIPGGTAGAIRQELSSGLPTKGVFHWKKGYERGRQLFKLIESGKLNQHDMQIAKVLFHQLRQSLMGY